MGTVAMFVMNSVEFDRRVLREAASLTRAGYSVTVIGAATDESLPGSETRPEGFQITRIPLRRQAARAARDGSDAAPSTGPLRSKNTLLWLALSRFRWSLWSREAVRRAAGAVIFHGHDLPGLGVAVAARSLQGGGVIYDSHDLFVESGANARRPRWAKRALSSVEARWYRQADHLITVNGGIADRLHERYGPKPTSIVYNCVPRNPAPLERPYLFHERLGLHVDTPIVLYHGGFSAARGLGHLIRAMAEHGMESAHLVLMGYGPMEGELRRLAGGTGVHGRVHVLSAVPPDELDRYVASADVVAMVNQPVSENEVLSTPNKLFEAIGAGVPVVTSDFPLRRRIVIDDPDGPLGVVCDPSSPAAIARASMSLLDLPAEARDEQRRRCLAAAHRRWNWEVEEQALLEAYVTVTAKAVGRRHARRSFLRLGQRGERIV